MGDVGGRWFESITRRKISSLKQYKPFSRIFTKADLKLVSTVPHRTLVILIVRDVEYLRCVYITRYNKLLFGGRVVVTMAVVIIHSNLRFGWNGFICRDSSVG